MNKREYEQAKERIKSKGVTALMEACKLSCNTETANTIKKSKTKQKSKSNDFERGM